MRNVPIPQLPLVPAQLANVPRSNTNLILILYYTFKIIPVIVAAGAIYLGYRLFILGVTGQASLSVNTSQVRGQLLNAAPGLFFAVGGIVTIIVTVWKGVDISFNNGGQDFGNFGMHTDNSVITDR